jgi:hypothetical protein
MFVDALKGLLLEEALGYVLKSSGYRVIHAKSAGDSSLAGSGLTLRVRGRGADHQADVLGDLHATPAFCSPLRLFVEAKWQSTPGARVKIPVVRAAMGTLSDVNQFWRPTAKKRGGARVASARYDYRFVIFSRFGFTSKAIDLAAVHHIHLVDLSSPVYHALVSAVDALGNAIVDEFPATGAAGRSQTTLKASLVRSMIRRALFPSSNAFLVEDASVEERLSEHVRTFTESLASGSHYFIATTSTGYVVLMVAQNPAPLLHVLERNIEPTAQLHFETRDPTLWRMTLGHERDLFGASFEFSLPEEMIRPLLAQETVIKLRQEALGFKGAHFSEFWIFAAPMLPGTAPILRRVRIDQEWLTVARNRLARDRRGLDGGP